MAFFSFFKEKIIEPTIHENEQGLTLTEGAHILNNCNKVKLDGTAVVLESHNTNYDSIKGKSKVQIMVGGKINEVSERAKLGFLKDAYIANIKGKVEVTTVNSCNIDYVFDHCTIRTFNSGCIKFINDRVLIDTMNNGKILFARHHSKIGTMSNGSIEGLIDSAQISTIQNGKINFVLNRAYIGTIVHCSINEVCDNTEIGTFTDGEINVIVGNSIVCQQMGGKVSTKQYGPIIVYNAQKDGKRERMPSVRSKKILVEEPKKEIQSRTQVIQTSLLDSEKKNG